MTVYEVCSACACHLKREEPSCPFCGAPHTPHPRKPIRLRGRVSRAHWLAFGSTLAIMNCSDSTSLRSDQPVDATQPPLDAVDDGAAGTADSAVAPDVGSPEDAAADSDTGALDVISSDDAAVADGDDASRDDAAVADADAAPSDVRSDASAGDASADIFVDAADAGSCTPPTGTFRCVPWSPAVVVDGGAWICDSASQYCMRGPSPQGCFDNEAADADADGVPHRSLPPQCLPCPTCECVLRYAEWANGFHPCTCDVVDDRGAIALSCGGCYGSPPARLERFLRSVS